MVDSFIYYPVYRCYNNRMLLMAKIETKFWICNCVHGHQNCTCDGITGAKKLKCIGEDCNEYIYSKTFQTYRCEECYKIHCLRKEMAKK